MAEDRASGVSHTASPAEEEVAEDEVFGSRTTAKLTDPRKPRPEDVLEYEKPTYLSATGVGIARGGGERKLLMRSCRWTP